MLSLISSVKAFHPLVVIGRVEVPESREGVHVQDNSQLDQHCSVKHRRTVNRCRMLPFVGELSPDVIGDGCQSQIHCLVQLVAVSARVASRSLIQAKRPVSSTNSYHAR